ncbi:MAG: DNA methyltransferase [Wenyingzhuangia sp.]|uniref:DNA methyltransferase n=1 Tax=Wenyingzhuangia sp. TaxID=1964193 RepID=UPI003219FA3A
MKVKVSSLKHHPKNKDIYELSSIDQLIESIKDVGLLQPLIIDTKNQVISGNRRLKSIRILKWEEVDVIQRKVNKEDEEKLLIHYNKQRIKKYKELLNEYFTLVSIHQKGQGRRTDLTSVKSDIGSSRDLVAKMMGVSSSQLQRLIFIHKHHPDHIELLDKGIFTVNQSYLQIQRELKEKKSRKNKTSIPSSLENLSSWRCYQKSSSNMNELNEGEVQTIFTSPPYWNKRRYSEEEGLGNEKTSEEFVVNLSEHLIDCKRVLNDRGSFFLNLGDTFYNGNLQNIPHRVILKLQQQGWILRNTIIWSKTNPKPSASKSNLTPSYEFIFHLTKSKEYDYNPTLTKLSSESKPSLPPRHRSVNGEYSNSISPYLPNIRGKNMGDYWNEDIVRTSVANQKLNIMGEHPAPFPEEIITLPILQTSKEFELVLDPFMGSGTTGRVCDKLGRRFVGYDLKKY